MNQKKVNQLRKIARTLPDVWISKHVIEMVPGKNLTAAQKKYVVGKVIPDKMYRISKHCPVSVNHYDRLLNIYKLQGDNGVTRYINHSKTVGDKQQKQKEAAGIKIEKGLIIKPSLISRIKRLLKKIFISQYDN